jgi:uncharacterized OB-fold protein
VSGRGAVYTWTVMHEPRVAGFEAAVPYATIVVELEESTAGSPVLLVGNLKEVPPDEIRLGEPVEVWFEDLNEELALPQFRRSAE